MAIHEDWQIHIKTGFRPIELQESQSGPHTNRTPHNKENYELVYLCTRLPLCTCTQIMAVDANLMLKKTEVSRTIKD